MGSRLRFARATVPNAALSNYTHVTQSRTPEDLLPDAKGAGRVARSSLHHVRVKPDTTAHMQRATVRGFWPTFIPKTSDRTLRSTPWPWQLRSRHLACLP